MAHDFAHHQTDHFAGFLPVYRAIEMADEFDWVEVTGVDLAPVQPR